MAAEYILKEGNEAVMLCERGIRTFETSYRFTLDLMAVPVLKELTHLPVVVDPSHAAGRRDLVLPLSLAAAAVGADGLIVETHPAPDDGDLRRTAAARRGRVRRLPAPGRGGGGARGQGAGARLRAHAGRARSLTRAGAMRIAVLGVGLIGGSVGLARAQPGMRSRRFRRRPGRARGAPSNAARSTVKRASVEAAVEGADALLCVRARRSAAGARRGSARRCRRALRDHRRRVDEAGDRRGDRRRALHRRPSGSRLRGGRHRGGARGHVSRRHLVPDPRARLLGSPL